MIRIKFFNFAANSLIKIAVVGTKQDMQKLEFTEFNKIRIAIQLQKELQKK